MPRYQFAVQPDGLTLRVKIGLDQQTIGRLLSAGLTPPRSLTVDALVDTGADFTGVSAAVIAQLGLPYLTTVQTQTASGVAVQRQFWASVGLPRPLKTRNRNPGTRN